ncbi:MAG TPA: type II toxin-antitoxin system VapC family toxin [Burkholderiaceae bacterium]
MILLDTVVVSELRKARPNPRVIEWMRGLRESDVFLSVVTIGEIERGISKVRDAEFAQALTRWLEDLLRFYGDRVLPVTPDIARRWGRLSADLGHEGADLLVAATAASHRLTVATRNVRHFAPTGVAVFDPFKAPAP